ncbi:hypothetical protein EUGRSUZ_H04895 [Eucalyptus grandis]|uniref:Uncharacterized protein n=2 Tax=Eucalyptus grandis TaxID=71139 RepID=A0ACC3JYX0_EUCGR|nr:hypothetical protein EUGRSUZ_H04895 [Eucalyptus grandis]
MKSADGLAIGKNLLFKHLVGEINKVQKKKIFMDATAVIDTVKCIFSLINAPTPGICAISVHFTNTC